MRRTRLAVAAMSGALLLAGLSGPTGAQASEAGRATHSSWWWIAQGDNNSTPVTDVAPDEIAVRRDVHTETKQAAVWFDVSDVVSPPDRVVLRLRGVRDTRQGTGGGVILCPLKTGWSEADGGAWSQRPVPDCRRVVRAARPDSQGYWSFDVTPFVWSWASGERPNYGLGLYAQQNDFDSTYEIVFHDLRSGDIWGLPSGPQAPPPTEPKPKPAPKPKPEGSEPALAPPSVSAPGTPGVGTPGVGTPGVGTPGVGTPGVGTPGVAPLPSVEVGVPAAPGSAQVPTLPESPSNPDVPQDPGPSTPDEEPGHPDGDTGQSGFHFSADVANAAVGWMAGALPSSNNTTAWLAESAAAAVGPASADRDARELVARSGVFAPGGRGGSSVLPLLGVIFSLVGAGCAVGYQRKTSRTQSS